MLMPAAFDRVPLTISPLGLQHVQWSAPIASGRYAEGFNSFVSEWHYFPTMVEIAIFVGAVAYVGFLLILAIDRLPIVRQATR
jgi:Ni/Fe-hydrogenase subunit HybB-like protein